MTTNTILLTRTKSKAKRFGLLNPTSVSSRAEIQTELPKAGKHTLWISDERSMVRGLLKSVNWPPKRLGRALLLFTPNVETLATLHECFDRIAFGSRAAFLLGEELAEALTAENRSDLFIGGTVDKGSETVTLWRGNLDALVVPFSAFPSSGDGVKANFNEFAVADYGQTVRFGRYEAASDAILYEFDPGYRRRKAKQRLASERTFGASLRRLRNQRGLRRDDFKPLAAKTLARIEQGKIKSVHKKTLMTIAKRLGVKPEEIETY